MLKKISQYVQEPKCLIFANISWRKLCHFMPLVFVIFTEKVQQWKIVAANLFITNKLS